jgi:hypothetical protein
MRVPKHRLGVRQTYMQANRVRPSHKQARAWAGILRQRQQRRVLPTTKLDLVSQELSSAGATSSQARKTLCIMSAQGLFPEQPLQSLLFPR